MEKKRNILIGILIAIFVVIGSIFSYVYIQDQFTVYQTRDYFSFIDTENTTYDMAVINLWMFNLGWSDTYYESEDGKNLPALHVRGLNNRLTDSNISIEFAHKDKINTVIYTEEPKFGKYIYEINEDYDESEAKLTVRNKKTLEVVHTSTGTKDSLLSEIDSFK